MYKLIFTIFLVGLMAGVFSTMGLVVQPRPQQFESTWHITTKHILSPLKSSQRCSFHKSPVIGNKQQVLDSSQIKSGFVHHIDLFQCTPPTGKSYEEVFDKYLGPEGYNCDQNNIPSQYCKYYLEWSCPYPPPSIPDRYPPNVGSTVEENEYLYMVVHYENPDLLKNVEVATGWDFKYSNLTKKYTAGFIQVGRYVSYKNLIPPNSVDFVVQHKCQSDCTEKFPEKINIFGVTFHAHSNAKQVKLYHIRNGETISTIAHDVHYSPEEPFKFKMLGREVEFLPGDELQVECNYDTTGSNGDVKIGGNSLESEMCIAFVEYYPKTLKVSTCGTTLGASAIKNFFGINEFINNDGIDPIIASPMVFKGHTFTEVVKSLQWTVEQRKNFQQLMINGEKDSYCFN